MSPPVFRRAPFSSGSFPSQAPGRCLCSWSASRCYSSPCVSLADVFSLSCLPPAVPGREAVTLQVLLYVLLAFLGDRLVHGFCPRGTAISPFVQIAMSGQRTSSLRVGV